MRRWKLKLIVGGILGIFLVIFAFVPFKIKAFNNYNYQYIAYINRVYLEGLGEYTNDIYIIASVSSDSINYSTSNFRISTAQNKNLSAAYDQEIDLDNMQESKYYLINTQYNYGATNQFFVTRYSQPFNDLNSIFEYLQISYDDGYNLGLNDGYKIGYQSAQELDSENNLLTASNIASNFTLNGITFTNNGDGTFTLNGTCTKSTSYTVGTTPQYTPNHTYYAYTGIVNGSYASEYYVQFTYLNSSNTPQGALDYGEGVKFTTPIEVAYGYRSIYFRIGKNKSFNNQTFLFQLYDITALNLDENLSASEIYDKLKYIKGFNDGFNDGEDIGYKKGINQGTKDSFTLINFLGNIISVFFSAAFTFLSFEVFGIKLWEIFSILASIGVIIIVYRLIKGGGD